MKLSCPTCATSFTVPTDLIGPKGRKVKCATCAYIWRAFPGDDVSQKGDDAFGLTDDFVAVSSGQGDDKALASGPVAGGSGKPRKPGFVKLSSGKRGSGGKLRLGVPVWARRAGSVAAKVGPPVGVALGLVLLVLGVVQRDATVRFFPDLAPLFEAAGMTVNVRGVSFSQFTAQRQLISGVSLLRIEGDITNTQNTDVSLGPLRLALLSQTGAELFVWSLEPELAGLTPGQSLTITSELSAPPESVASVSVRFLLDDEELPRQVL